MKYPCWALGHSMVWEYDNGERSCHQRGFCEHRGCNTTSQRLVHDLDSWALTSPDSMSCEIKRSCKRCGSPEYSTEHDYQWRYYIDGSCEQKQVCIRCGIMGTVVRISHAWRGWELSQDGNSLQNLCPRCSEFQKKPAQASSL
jgi:hypothetical protein